MEWMLHLFTRASWRLVHLALMALLALAVTAGWRVLHPQATAFHTYHVRIDGGSAEECTGLADAPYPGKGTGQPCAWDHPFRALPPRGQPRLKGGDTLRIAPGSYMMGYGAPGSDSCEAHYPWDCHMPPVPSGPDAEHPTRIVGGDGLCRARPELWGTERARLVLNLTDVRHVEVACLEITDHAACATYHGQAWGGSQWACEREVYPYGPWAATGLYAEDATDVTLRHLDIHGLAEHGIRAGRLTDWAIEDVRLVANGWVGWEGDIDGEDTNQGTLRFSEWTVAWNGCVETYPGRQPTACWGQTAGGYGDGVGTGQTGGNWLIQDSQFLHNTSDGLDLLYHEFGGRISLERVRAEGNAGNQIKLTGPALITNSVLIGNCAFFADQPFTYHVDHCRALGNTLELAYIGGETIHVVNSTLYGQGDGIISAGAREAGDCTGAERCIGRNNILLGDADWNSPGDVTFHFYQEGCGTLQLDSDYSVAHRTKNILCGAETMHVKSGDHDQCLDPKLTGPLNGMYYGIQLSGDSPAIDAGSAAWAPGQDITGASRDPQPDVGAHEWHDGRRRVLPLLFR